jgi:phosphoglycerate dehydrogenase-like enzyme
MTFEDRLMVMHSGCGLRCVLLARVLTGWAVPIIAAPSKPTPEALALIETLSLPASPVAARDLPGWRVPTQIAVAYADSERLAQLQAAVPDVRLRALDRQAPLPPQLADVQAVVGVCSAEVLAAAKQLHWIQLLSVGVERCVVVPGLAERGIVLSNMQRTSAVPIAEHAIAMMMALARGLPHYGRAQQVRVWRGDADERQAMREVTGRTLLVVGLGGIGTEVARRAHGLGMRVIATRNSSRDGPDFVAQVGLPDELLTLAAQADVVVNATPLTPETTDLFDRTFFAALKPGAYFINVGRGRSVVTDALVAALRSGRVAGAGLDVVEPEPLPKSHALWLQPNVIITPHVAASSDVQGERYWIVVAENLRRYVAGEPLLNVVDIARGY